MPKGPKDRSAPPTPSASPSWSAGSRRVRLRTTRRRPTRLVTYAVGDRTLSSARLFMEDPKERVSNRVQITADGHRAYVEAIEGAFGEDVDFAQLVKLYGPTPSPPGRYRPA
jgi:hypothetical protein